MPDEIEWRVRFPQIGAIGVSRLLGEDAVREQATLARANGLEPIVERRRVGPWVEVSDAERNDGEEVANECGAVNIGVWPAEPTTCVMPRNHGGEHFSLYGQIWE